MNREKDAAVWSVRKDRGFTAKEEKVYSKILFQEPGLSNKIDDYDFIESSVDQLNMDFVEQTLRDNGSQRSSRWIRNTAWAAAAMLAISMVGLWHYRMASMPGQASLNPEIVVDRPSTQRLPDGSVIRANAGSRYLVEYTASYRKIKLFEGEAHFQVEKNRDLPFLVECENITVSALGTAFNVRHDTDLLTVLVTEGVIQITNQEAETVVPTVATVEEIQTEPRVVYNQILTKGQGAELKIENTAEEMDMNVYNYDLIEIDTYLEWRKSLMTITGSTIADIAENFEEKTGYTLQIANPEVNRIRIGGQFPSDDVFGFLRALELGYGIHWTIENDQHIVISL